MLSVLAKILGSGDVIEKGLNLIDDMHTSKAEEIEAKNKAKIDLLTAYAPFKVAQRYLALMFGITYLLCFLIALIMTLLGYGNIQGIKFILSDFYIGEIMLAIIAFYFGGGLFESAKKK
tara:strand:- start:795 stop:1151 length:357 start_codon:yes stop_codon:yes gene_type:complete